jgi:hypothetical protein
MPLVEAKRKTTIEKQRQLFEKTKDPVQKEAQAAVLATMLYQESKTKTGDDAKKLVDEARQALRAALIAKLNASPSAEELQRIAEVMKRATDELRRAKK